jgi:Flp pilus assembly protein TadD
VAPLNKRRALAMIEQAKLHAARGEWTQVEALARQVADSELKEPHGVAFLGDALRALGRRDEAVRALEAGLREYPTSPELEARLGSLCLEGEDFVRAVELLGRARLKFKREPSVLTQYAAALLRVGRVDDAEQALAQALFAGGGADSKLVLALVKARRGKFDDAQGLAAEVEARASNPQLKATAQALQADARLMLGDAAGALERWTALEAEGRLEPGQLAHMAWAAQLVGQPERADRLIAERIARGALAEDLLMFAHIDNLRREPARALERLAAAGVAKGEHGPDWDFQLAAVQGRALRLLHRADESLAVLERATALPELHSRLGAAVLVDLGHLAADRGDFERAAERFEHALRCDPDDPEARRGLELAKERTAWRDDAAARVDLARAEAESLRRRFLSRETELEGLRAEIDRLKQTAAEAMARAARAEVEGRTRLEAERKQRLREELEAREREVEARAKENLERAFDGAALPDPMGPMLLVAERTYQQALYTELPSAAVAVLFSGALERSLMELIVRPFDSWLEHDGRREAFLTGATREVKGRRVEYYDRLVEAFDRGLDSRVPGLGEVARVLVRRDETYLAPFKTFLHEHFTLDDAFFTAFATFVSWSKEQLRDPVAHGRLEIGWDELKAFREQLLFSFQGASPGVLPRLVRSRRVAR